MGKREAGQIYGVAKAMLLPPFHYFWEISTEGLSNVPSSGGAILAPNHISVLDSFFVPCAIPRRITYVGKAEYMDDWKTKYLFPAMGMIPIDRSGGDASARALDAATSVLEAGELFGIYPEGTRARDGLLHKGHTGVARLALRTGAPIIPVGIIGSDLIQPADASRPKIFRKVRIRFGPPISVEKYMDRADDRLVLRQVTDEVMYEIRNLSGQEYVNTYATQGGECETIAPVVPMPTRTQSEGGSPVIASAAYEAGGPVRDTADGVDRRSSRSAIKSRPLDLDLQLAASTG